jgi:superoxide dismutase
VFDADSLEDPKMDSGIKMVFEHLIKHDEFIKFLEELSPKVMDKSKVKTEQEQFNFKRNTDYLIFITMFSHQLFYLTHQCICKMLVNKHVGDELIGDLKGKLLQIFSH